jgi:hypothetical protein
MPALSPCQPLFNSLNLFPYLFIENVFKIKKPLHPGFFILNTFLFCAVLSGWSSTFYFRWNNNFPASLSSQLYIVGWFKNTPSGKTNNEQRN